MLREGKEQDPKVKVAERPTDEMLAKKEPAPAEGPGRNGEAAGQCSGILARADAGRGDDEPVEIPAKTTGVVVSSVETGGPAEAAGLQRGDVIQEVNHEVVKTLEDYQKASAKVKKDEMACCC